MNEVKISDRYINQANPKGLKFGIIEVTTNCQCACPGCYMVRRDALNHGEMTLGAAVRILDLCREYTGRELETMDLLGGEPLLWPYLKPFIETLQKRGIVPWVFTNMLAITPKLAAWLFDRGVYITGKLNIDPSKTEQFQLQAKMIGCGMKMAKKMVDSIAIFQAAGYRAPLFRLQNLIRRENIKFVPGYYRWCLENEIGTDLELMGSGETVGPEYWKIAPNPREIADMITVLKQNHGIQSEVLMPHVFGACPFYDKGLYFAVDGHIRACSNSTVILGYTDEKNSVQKAYESELICRRLNLRKENMGEPCRSCYKWDKCRGGCRATVEGLGDPFGGYPLCPVPLLSA